MAGKGGSLTGNRVVVAVAIAVEVVVVVAEVNGICSGSGRTKRII